MKNVKKQLVTLMIVALSAIGELHAQSITDTVLGGISSAVKKTDEKLTEKYITINKYLKEKVSDLDAGKILNDVMTNNGIADDEEANKPEKKSIGKGNTKKKAIKKLKAEKDIKIDLDELVLEKRNKAYELKYLKKEVPSTLDLACRMMADRKNATVDEPDENVVMVSHTNEKGEEDCTWKLRKLETGKWKFKITKAEDIIIMEKYLRPKIIAKIVEESFVTTKNNIQ